MKNLGHFRGLFLPGTLIFRKLGLEHGEGKDYNRSDLIPKEDGEILIGGDSVGMEFLTFSNHTDPLVEVHCHRSDHIVITCEAGAISYYEIESLPLKKDCQESVVTKLQIISDWVAKAEISWIQEFTPQENKSWELLKFVTRVNSRILHFREVEGAIGQVPPGIMEHEYRLLNQRLARIPADKLIEACISVPVDKPLDKGQLRRLHGAFPSARKPVRNSLGLSFTRAQDNQELHLLYETYSPIDRLPRRARQHIFGFLGYIPDLLKVSTDGNRRNCLITNAQHWPDYAIEGALESLIEYHRLVWKFVPKLQTIYKEVEEGEEALIEFYEE